MRFNQPSKGISKTLNCEGDVAYKLSPELELYSTVCTASLQPKFYEGSDETIRRLRKLIKKNKASFVAKLAIYAREKMYLRSVPLVLVAELAKVHKGDKLISQLTERVIQRADEIMELLSYYQLANERNDTKKLNKLSKQIQIGLSLAFHKFNEYQLAKYNRDGVVRLRDALFLCHPKPKNKDETKLFKKIVEDKLEVPFTWEVELSKAGQDNKDVKEVWEKLIESKKVGYMALLRNLRNILNADVSNKHLKIVTDYLSNEEAVKNSRQLPFRFLSAYRELENNESSKVSKVFDALEKAVLITAHNIKGYDENTKVVVACDVSGSMQTTISPRSKIQNYDIGLVLGMLLKNRCKNVITGIFGDEWKVKNLPKDSILRNAMDLHRIEGEVGYSTNGYKVVEYLLDKKTKVDKIMIFTDCQMWDSYDEYQGRGAMKILWSKYKKFNPEAKMYLFDLSGYGTTPLDVNDSDVYFIAGWSDKIFGVLDALERGSTALKEIDNIDFSFSKK